MTNVLMKTSFIFQRFKILAILKLWLMLLNEHLYIINRSGNWCNIFERNLAIHIKTTCA